MTAEDMMDSMDSFKFNVVWLNFHNFFTGPNDIEILLRRKCLWNCVLRDKRAPSGQWNVSAATECRRKDLAVAHVVISIEPFCKSSVTTKHDPKEVWKKLSSSYQSVFEAAIDINLTELHQIHMFSNESMIKYSNGVDGFVNEVKICWTSHHRLGNERVFAKGSKERVSSSGSSDLDCKLFLYRFSLPTHCTWGLTKGSCNRNRYSPDYKTKPCERSI